MHKDVMNVAAATPQRRASVTLCGTNQTEDYRNQRKAWVVTKIDRGHLGDEAHTISAQGIEMVRTSIGGIHGYCNIDALKQTSKTVALR